MPQGYVIERLESPEDLLAALGRWNHRWQPHCSDWVYRGQADSSWDLLPLAHRPTCSFRYAAGLEYRLDTTRSHTAQIGAESDLIRAFAKEMDRQGLALPTEASFEWSNFTGMVNSILGQVDLHDWPTPAIAPLFALAQHHGIPTRLLDWTARPYVAAYFAAVDAAARLRDSPQASEKCLSVWALSHGRAGAVLMGNLQGSTQPHLRTVRAPRATNEFLRAQEGLFTLLVRTVGLPLELYMPPALDSILAERLQELENEGRGVATLLLRLDLPWSQAGRLLRFLANEFISAAQLYPGLGGAARAVQERALWDILTTVAGD